MSEFPTFDFHYPSGLASSQVVICYHAPCQDGIAAAWAAYKRFGKRARYIPASHVRAREVAKEIADTAIGKHVFVLDFSFSPEDVELIQSSAASLVILDHHISAAKSLSGHSCAFFDMERSGAGIAWDYFHPGISRPHLIRHIEDRDLWRFKHVGTKEFSAWLSTKPLTLQSVDDLSESLEGIPDYYQKSISAGIAMLEYQDYLVERICKNQTTYGKMDVYDRVPFVCSGVLQSEIGNYLVSKEDECFPIAVIWSPPGSKGDKYIYSLRSSEVDVSLIAKRFGGGGHRLAAGFSSHMNPEEIQSRE
jgi:oligoribonuclease NrnB/cAMP/cGMP phosphodiesterase (DHH superfamily)